MSLIDSLIYLYKRWKDKKHLFDISISIKHDRSNNNCTPFDLRIEKYFIPYPTKIHTYPKEFSPTSITYGSSLSCECTKQNMKLCGVYI
jgi:hypothetical protein